MADKRTGKHLIKNVIMLLIVAGAAVFVYLQVKKRARIALENQAVEYQNQGDYEKAIDSYCTLVAKLNDDDADRIEENIARCYVAMAEEPDLSFEQALKLYKKAHSYDPDAVTNPAILKRIESTE